MLCSSITISVADQPLLTIKADQPGTKLSADFYGLMTEEINHSYDGGLYAELLQNRNFKEDDSKPAHWSVANKSGAVGSLLLSDSNPVSPALSRTLELHINAASVDSPFGVANDGYWGLPVKPRCVYKASFYAEGADGFTGPLKLALESADGKTTFARAEIAGISGQWQQYTLQLTTGRCKESSNNRFAIYATHSGTLRLSLVSLFPPTFNNRPNGNRPDIMEALAGLQPAFLRFPGGNFVDPGHYEWKKTIGPLTSRPGGDGAWGYRVTDGLGILEFFEWCEDLNMQPVLDVTDGRGWLPASGDVAPLVQDALDEIEYATGGPETVWGAKRVADGHPAAFPLKYIEIGNEDFFDNLETYNARFARFYDAIRAKYPQLMIIATRDDVSSRVPDIIDDHYYFNPQDMEAKATNYDNYDRSKPKVFVGEWRTSEVEHPVDFNDTLGDAAWLTGLERNADVVVMECYAPLLFNINPDAYNTPVNLIGYDSLHTFGTPSYYMQQMFARGHGDIELPVQLTGAVQQQPDVAAPSGAIGVGTWNGQAEFRNVNVVSGSQDLYDGKSKPGALDGWTAHYGDWHMLDGVLSQTGKMNGCIATIGDSNWTNYSLTLQARRTGGRDGLQFYVHYRDSDNCLRWDIGGNGGPRSIRKFDDGSSADLGTHSSFPIENDRWYDIRIDVDGREIACYVDEVLVEKTSDPVSQPRTTLFASASRESKNGNIWLHLVNISSEKQSVRLNLVGSGTLNPSAVAEVLQSDTLDSVNTIEKPTNIIPRQSIVSGVSPDFSYDLPGHSIVVLNLKARP